MYVITSAYSSLLTYNSLGMALLMYAFTSAYSSLLTYDSLGMVSLFSVCFSVCVIISGGEGAGAVCPKTLPMHCYLVNLY